MGLVLSVQGFRAYRGLVPDFSGGFRVFGMLGDRELPTNLLSVWKVKAHLIPCPRPLY